MATDQPSPADQPSRRERRPPQSSAPEDPPRDPQEQLRQVTRHLAAAMPAESLPTAPIAPDSVRQIAADLAAELLHQIAEPQSEAMREDAVWRSLSYNCTGHQFICRLAYGCAGGTAHSCTNKFDCGIFSCTIAFAGFQTVVR